jgi:predicted nucleic acid-binding protein
MLDKIFAAFVVLICALLALRLLLGAQRRARMDARLRGLWRQLRGWRYLRQNKKRAEAQAEAAIRRARSASRMEDGEWDGNVYRPKKFGGKPRKPH